VRRVGLSQSIGGCLIYGSWFLNFVLLDSVLLA
jgi:hypothetical protein